jgi:ribonuclease Z
MHARFRGFTWNLEQPECSWFVTEVCKKKLVTFRFEKHELFKHKHFVEEVKFDRTILDLPTFYVDSIIMEHKTPTLSFCIREKPQQCIDEKKLQRLNLSKGAWLQVLKDKTKTDAEVMQVQGSKFTLGDLRKSLLTSKKTDSIAYLTDFRLNKRKASALKTMIEGCQIIVCESMYDNEDIDLAEKNYHLVASESAEIAKNAGAKKLYLIHVSERYTPAQMLGILEQAREVFPKTYFPKTWLKNLLRKTKQ